MWSLACGDKLVLDVWVRSTKKFNRSHAPCFYFVKDPKRFILHLYRDELNFGGPATCRQNFSSVWLKRSGAEPGKL